MTLGSRGRPALLLVPVVVAAWAATAHAQAREMTMGTVIGPKHGTAQTAQQFIDKLSELTGGKVKVIHHHSGALGGEREVAQQIQLGTVDFGPITTAPLSTLVPEMSVFQLPYIFRDYAHVYAALDWRFEFGTRTKLVLMSERNRSMPTPLVSAVTRA